MRPNGRQDPWHMVHGKDKLCCSLFRLAYIYSQLLTILIGTLDYLKDKNSGNTASTFKQLVYSPVAPIRVLLHLTPQDTFHVRQLPQMPHYGFSVASSAAV